MDRRVLENLRSEIKSMPDQSHVRVACATLKSLGWQEEDHPDVVVAPDGLTAAVSTKVLGPMLDRILDS